MPRKRRKAIASITPDIPYPKVRVEWIDCVSDSGWATDKEFDKMKLARPVNEGWLYSKDKESVKLFASYDKDADTNDDSFEEVFGGDWYDDDCWDGLEDCNVGFQETEDADEGYCEFDDEIQEFIDEKPKREKENQIHNNDVASNNLPKPHI